MNNILEFYNQHHFPGPYSIQSITAYDINNNQYVSTIDQYLNNNQQVLDVGCGTGLLTNLFSLKYKESKFTGIDFSTAIDYASKFSKTHKIKNVRFVKKDFFEFDDKNKYDVIIGQSFLTHVPDWPSAVKKLKSLLAPNGIMIMGIYHPSGKWAQRFIINYGNDRLKLDQTFNPFEQAFSVGQIKRMFKDYQLIKITPSICGHFTGLRNLFNARNGGLTMYVLKENNYE